MRGVFIDTWGWIALLCKEDQWHAATKATMREVLGSTIPVYTSWAVIAELLTVASGSRGRALWGREARGTLTSRLAEWLDRRELLREVIAPSAADWRQSFDLRSRHAGLAKLSLVDCTIAVTCGQRGITDIVSGDEDLRVIYPGARLLPQEAASND